MYYNVSVLHSFLLMNNIPSYGYSTFYLSIPQLMDRIVSILGAIKNNAVMNFRV